MRLTLWTDYALRTLIYVGAKGGRLSTIAEIAESFDISKTHLMKVVNRLGQQGYIETVRGKGGGIRLARSPAEIRVGAVVRETEEDLAVMGCLAETGILPDRRMLRAAARAPRGDAGVFAYSGRLHPGRSSGPGRAARPQPGSPNRGAVSRNKPGCCQPWMMSLSPGHCMFSPS